MRGSGRGSRLGLGLIGTALMPWTVLALTGQVVDTDGKPIPGARACLMMVERELLCASTDPQGYFDLVDSHVPKLRISAEGFLPRTVAAVTQEVPIALERASALSVRLLEAGTGKPISKGEVFVIYSTGRQVGPLPSNAAGLRIRTLVPGEARARARAPGYLDSRGVPVNLVAGSEAEIAIELAPDPDAPAGGDAERP